MCPSRAAAAALTFRSLHPPPLFLDQPAVPLPLCPPPQYRRNMRDLGGILSEANKRLRQPLLASKAERDAGAGQWLPLDAVRP